MSTSIAPDAWRVLPWKNGRGTTSEVYRDPEAPDYELRISVAEVTASGPFSTFPGYTRWTLLLDGGPIWLNEQPLGFVRFAGETAIASRVERPGRLLNVIGRDITVGVGDARADIVFDLVTHVTSVLDAPAPVRGLWVQRTAR